MSSKIVLAAKLTAVDAAAADKVEQHLKKIRDHALSDAEPGTLLYYPTRGNDDPLQFLVFEEYESKEAMQAHLSTPVFGAFGAEMDNILKGGKAALDLAYYKRF